MLKYTFMKALKPTITLLTDEAYRTTPPNNKKKINKKEQLKTY